MTGIAAGSIVRSQPDYRFDFCGGHLALDFANTVGTRGGEPVEHLNTYGDLVAWGEARGVLSSGDAERVMRAASRDPIRAARALRRARDLRESIYGVFARRAAGKAPSAGDLSTLNRFVGLAYGTAQLVADRDRVLLAIAAPSDPLEGPFAPVVPAAVELLTGDRAALVGICADETCGWLFLDTTRNRTRRWCDMKECGNRNKVRRFRARSGDSGPSRG